MNKLFTINDFEGPLDLLLHLVRKSEVDIYEINTTTIIEEYLDYIHAMETLNINIASEYLVMASELVRLKSKMLINSDISEDPEEETEFNINSEEDLKNRIAEYAKYKNLSEEFKTLEEKRSEVYTKIPENLSEYKEASAIEFGKLSITDLLKAFEEFKARQLLAKPLNTKITRKEITISDKINHIHELLNQKTKFDFLELFDELTNENVIVTFLAILQMSKNDEIIISQADNFSPITIEKRG